MAPKNEVENRDKLSMKKAVETTGWERSRLKFYKSVGAWDAIKKAVANDWFDSDAGMKLFANELKQTEWFKKNAEPARAYYLAEAQGGADFSRSRELTKSIVRQQAVNLGAELDDDDLEALTTAYMTNGWGDAGNEYALARAITGSLEGFDSNALDFTSGYADNVMGQLKSNARANGLVYSDSYYQEAVNQIAQGNKTLGDFNAEQRQMAASSDPYFKDRILAGENRRDIYSPYIATYAKMFDLDPEQVDLDDKHLQLAFNAEGGGALGLWDYKKALRQTDDWQYTKEAHDTVSSLVGRIGSMMGFGGSL